jgi:hypothetical protein
MLDSFSRKKDGLAGKRPICNECEKKRSKKYREENADKVFERNRKYREDNRDVLLERQKKWCEENPEQKAENDRKYRVNNREKCAEATRIWYEENKVHKISYNRKWVEENHEIHAGFLRKWRKDNPDKVRVLRMRREARKALLPDDFTTEQMKESLKRFKDGCALTGSSDIHWDHAIPLATGKGGTTAGNMIPLRSDLNISKSDSNLFEWFESNKERFGLDVSKFNNLIGYLSEMNGMSIDQYQKYYFSCFEQDKLAP